MRVDEFLSRLRNMIFDKNKVEYSDVELIDYINAAITIHCNECIDNGHGSFLLKSAQYQYEDAAPTDVLRWAGQYPMEIKDGKVYPYDGSVRARYYAHPGYVASTDDEIPIPDRHATRLLSLVSMLALNRNEYDISQDNMFADRQMLKERKGGGS